MGGGLPQQSTIIVDIPRPSGVSYVGKDQDHMRRGAEVIVQKSLRSGGDGWVGVTLFHRSYILFHPQSNPSRSVLFVVSQVTRESCSHGQLG